jgi:hypothetical protein
MTAKLKHRTKKAGGRMTAAQKHRRRINRPVTLEKEAVDFFAKNPDKPARAAYQRATKQVLARD